MPTLSERIKGRLAQSGSLLDALDAVGNLRAGSALVLTFLAMAIAVAVLGGISAWMTARAGFVGNLLFLLSFLIWIAIGLVGTTTAGILLSDDVWGRDRRTLVEALTAATLCVHRLVVLLLIALAIGIAYLVVLALLFFVCKIPWLGPVLYTFVFPVASAGSGVLLFALFYLALPLAAPCVWNGNGIAQALATLKEVLRRRPLQVFVLTLLLTLLTTVVAATIGFILFLGTGVTASMSLAVIGFGGDFGNAFANIADNGGGYSVAFGLGMAALFLLGSVPVALIAMKGGALIHKAAIAGLVLGDAEVALQRFFDSARQRLQPARETVHESRPVPAAPRVCPNAQCGAAVGPDDHFCVECGQKLK